MGKALVKMVEDMSVSWLKLAFITEFPVILENQSAVLGQWRMKFMDIKMYKKTENKFEIRI